MKEIRDRPFCRTVVNKKGEPMMLYGGGYSTASQHPRGYAFQGGATIQERGLAARVREKYDGDIIMPTTLRAAGDPYTNTPIKFYTNSIVHDNHDAPIDSVVLQGQRYPYSTTQFNGFLNYIYNQPPFRFDKYGRPIPNIRSKWAGQ